MITALSTTLHIDGVSTEGNLRNLAAALKVVYERGFETWGARPITQSVSFEGSKCSVEIRPMPDALVAEIAAMRNGLDCPPFRTAR